MTNRIISQLIKRSKVIFINSKSTLSSSFFFAAILSLAFNPFVFSYMIGYRKFDRIMGNATLVGIDAALRIQFFQVFNFVLIPVFLCVGVLFCNYFTSKMNDKAIDGNINEALSFLNSVSLCAFALTIIFILNKYNFSIDVGINVEQYFILTMPFIISVATLYYIKHPFVNFEIYRLGIFISLGLTLFITFLFQNASASNAVCSLFRFYGIFTISTIITVIIINSRIFLDFERLSLAFIPLSYGLLFAGLSLEVFNILNQHGIFIVNRLVGAKAVFVVFVLFSILLFIFANKKCIVRIKSYHQWETISIIGLLLSLSYFMAIPPLQINAGTDLFEQANHGMLANDFLTWGRFPMINSFDAHTLSCSLGMLVYGILNGDLLGASYYNYSFVWLLPTVLCTYLVYQIIFDKYFAFFFLLIAPRLSTLSVDMGVISIIAMLYAVRKQTFKAYLCLFFSVAVGLIYSIPTGFAYGGTAVIVTVIYLILGITNKRKFTDESIAFFKASCVFVGIMAVLYVGICFQQHLNPIKRAFEFLSVAMSTNNWSYVSLGDQSSLTFGLLYSILPIIVVACFIILITHFKKDPICYAASAFLLTYVMNVTRSLQRHSLAENSVDNVIYTAVLGVSLCIAAITPKQKRAVFVYFGMFVATAIINIGAIQGAGSIASSVISIVNNPAIYYDGATEKTTRVDLSAPLLRYKNQIGMINSVIPAGETYLDLSGQTMLYALSGREKPVYLNQSVTETSGTYSQKRLIDEIEEYDGVCDFALVNTLTWTMNIDGVNGFYRYYCVFEYLYQNYYPLCATTDDFTLWVRKSRYDKVSFRDKIEEYASFPLTIGETNTTSDLTIRSEVPLILKCGANDPIIIMPLAVPVTITPYERVSYEIELKYKSSVGGNCQIFYDFDGYNEKDSAIHTLTATHEYKVEYFNIAPRQDLTELKAIRIDPPSGSEFEVKSIRILRDRFDNINNVRFDIPIRHSDLTDNNWTNGILNGNPSHMLFSTSVADVLSKAKVIYSSTGFANVINIAVKEDLVSIETDKDASMFADGVVSADLFDDSRRIKPIGYDYLGRTHITNIGQIPYLWGQYDTKKSWNNTVVTSRNCSIGTISDNIQKKSKYALIEIDSPAKGNAVLAFQNSVGENVSLFNFTLLAGNNRYIIRCSTDWWWNNGVIRKYHVSTDSDVIFHKIKFLVGD